MCIIVPNTFIKDPIAIFPEDLQLWLDQTEYGFMMSADVACNITLHGFVHQKVH